jgi:hypothetical protein
VTLFRIKYSSNRNWTKKKTELLVELQQVNKTENPSSRYPQAINKEARREGLKALSNQTAPKQPFFWIVKISRRFLVKEA